jgi:predicted nuclease of predicted toxin-antitoxin system
MTQRIKYYLDEHVSRVVAKGLRRHGVDVLSVTEANMLGACDEKHLEKAAFENRCIFTQDDDFLRLHASGRIHAGIIYAQQGKAIGEIIAGLMLVYEVLSADDMRNHVEYL